MAGPRALGCICLWLAAATGCGDNAPTGGFGGSGSGAAGTSSGGSSTGGSSGSGGGGSGASTSSGGSSSGGTLGGSGGSSGSGGGTSGSSGGGAWDGGATDGGGSGPLVWPNAVSYANSDPWLSQHHTEIREIHPRILLIDFANGTTASDVTSTFNAQKGALMEGSRYHGYADPSAKPFLIWEIAKLVDLTDTTVPPGWTAPNSTKMPRRNGGIDIGALFTQKYADYYAIPDPKNPSHNMTMCELLAAGVVNEVRVVFNKTGSDSNVPEILEYKQMYDANDVARAGKFDANAGNGSFDSADLPLVGACGRSIRIGFLEMTGVLGNEMQVNGHNYEHLGYALPRWNAMFQPFANFDLDTKHGTPFSDWYGECPYGSNNCISYPDQNSVAWHTASASGTIKPFNQGCGNAHFPPNGRQNYDQTSKQTVLSTCEHYGLHDGPGGADIQTPYDASKLDAWKAMYGVGPTGGAWYMYWFQSFPGVNNKATTPDGAPMKNWWVYLYY